MGLVIGELCRVEDDQWFFLENVLIFLVLILIILVDLMIVSQWCDWRC